MKIEISESGLQSLKSVLDKRIMLNNKVSIFSDLKTEVVTKRNLLHVKSTHIYITGLVLTYFNEIEEHMITGRVNERYICLFSLDEMPQYRKEYLKLEKQIGRAHV